MGGANVAGLAPHFAAITGWAVNGDNRSGEQK
jgi:hypothetical protein